MQSRTVLVIVAIALCATLALGTDFRTIVKPGGGLDVTADTLDVAVEISSPETVEVPGLIPAVVRLRNMGNVSALVDSLKVTISDGYSSFTTGIPLSPGQVKHEFMPVPWVYGGGTETCTAWITYPEDTNHHNDTDVVIVNPSSGQSEGARTDVSKSPGPLSGSIARMTCLVSHTEPLNVTLFDVNGRAVARYCLRAIGAKESSLDLRGLRAGVYLVRLDDGRRSSLQKLVVQRWKREEIHMRHRAVILTFAVAVCTSVALGSPSSTIGRSGTGLPSTLDVGIDIVRPDTYEGPGLIPVQVRLTNMGDTSALVDSVKVTVSDGYNSFKTRVQLDPSESTLVFMPVPWVCPAGAELTCTAWIACPEDANHSNDTDVVIVWSPSAPDVATEIVSPADSEEPGPVTVQIRLINMFPQPAVVPRLNAKMVPSGYSDSSSNISIPVGESIVVTLSPWIYPGGTETCMAYITYPADSTSWNDTAIVVVSGSGITGWDGMEPHAGMSLRLTPSPLAGGVLQVEYSLNKSGPASVTIFDVLGRPVARRDFTGVDAGEFPLGLRSLSAGVYLVRLDDGHQGVVQKLVVQR